MPKITHQAVAEIERQIIESLSRSMPDGATEYDLSLAHGYDRRTVNNYLRRLAAEGHAYKTGRLWRLRSDVIVAEQVAQLAETLRQLPAEKQMHWMTRLLESINETTH